MTIGMIATIAAIDGPAHGSIGSNVVGLLSILRRGRTAPRQDRERQSDCRTYDESPARKPHRRHHHASSLRYYRSRLTVRYSRVIRLRMGRPNHNSDSGGHLWRERSAYESSR